MFVWFMVWYIYHEIAERLSGICFAALAKLTLNACWLYKNEYKKVIFIYWQIKKNQLTVIGYTDTSTTSTVELFKWSMNPIFCAINMWYPSDFNECNIDQQCYYKCRSHDLVNTAQQASLRIGERKKNRPCWLISV